MNEVLFSQARCSTSWLKFTGERVSGAFDGCLLDTARFEKTRVCVCAVFVCSCPMPHDDPEDDRLLLSSGIAPHGAIYGHGAQREGPQGIEFNA